MDVFLSVVCVVYCQVEVSVSVQKAVMMSVRRQWNCPQQSVH